VAAEHDRHRGHAGQRAAGEPVQEQLEQPGISGLVGRARDHHQVAGLDRGHQLGYAGVGPVQQGGAKIGEVDVQIRGAPGQSLRDQVRGLIGA
jgi:hypothetical protein